MLAVNGWMNHPTGFTLDDGEAVDVHPWSALFGNSYFWHEFVHMYVAGYIVTGFVLAGVYAWGALRGRWGRYERTALAIPLAVAAIAAPVQMIVGDWVAATSPPSSRSSSRRSRASARRRRARRSTCSAGTTARTCATGSRSRACSRSSPTTTRTRPCRGSTRCPPTTGPGRAVNVTRFAFQTMVGIGTGLAAARRGLRCTSGSASGGCPSRAGSTGALVLAGPASVVALIAGWVTTEVGRQPWVVFEVMRTSEAVTGGEGIPVGYATLVVVYAALAVGVWWVLRRLSRTPLEPVEADAVPVLAPAGFTDLPADDA